MTEEQRADPPKEQDSIAPVRPPVEEVYWQSRRRMAASSVMGIFAAQIYTFLTPDMHLVTAEMLTSIVWVYGAIIGAYMGFRMIERGFGNKQ